MLTPRVDLHGRAPTRQRTQWWQPPLLYEELKLRPKQILGQHRISTATGRKVTELPIRQVPELGASAGTEAPIADEALRVDHASHERA